jgi:hypothetical protein
VSTSTRLGTLRVRLTAAFRLLPNVVATEATVSLPSLEVRDSRAALLATGWLPKPGLIVLAHTQTSLYYAASICIRRQ